MHTIEHEQHCLKMLGNPFTEVHIWLDQYFIAARGVAHRIVLHHRIGIELGIAVFGEQARAALKLHIQDDFSTILPGPIEVAGLLYDRGHDIYLAQPLLDILWPGKYNLWDSF